ncbi:hypothetical protein MKW94_021790 [Papaver nudicaule]|uniref:Leucine-rich repeat-containing N-terminal plant-type domain-containing protein n=1 Tax=Papaver nudicaule TaxID=74823 RepID=A0AA41VWT1_PAPNU|nr:hypothetical protein [Papaver nudicaule]MCL7048922.1 hypothetical protein [Papaver nudicaule]
MAKLCLCFLLVSVFMIHQVFGSTDPLDVSVLRDMYKSLNQPPQLVGWNLKSAGDPCEESWKGITCSGSSVVSIQLNGLELNGTLGANLFYLLLNVKHLDISDNHIHGEIPSSLPPNATHVNLSYNNFNHNTTFLLKPMKYLEHLNLSHNSLSCPLGNIFAGFPNLKQMDLSYNRLTGDLPNSFESLTNLNELYLQRNRFTGSPSVLEHLPLHNLTIQMNRMSGEFPKKLFNIPNLRFNVSLSKLIFKPIFVQGESSETLGQFMQGFSFYYFFQERKKSLRE